MPCTYLGEIVHVKSDEIAAEIHFDLWWLYFAQVAGMMHLIANIYHDTESSFLWLARYHNPELLLADTRISTP